MKNKVYVVFGHRTDTTKGANDLLKAFSSRERANAFAMTEQVNLDKYGKEYQIWVELLEIE